MLRNQLTELKTKFFDWLENQEWANQIKNKWHELPPENQFALTLTGLGLTVVVILGSAIGLALSARNLRLEYEDKLEVLSLIQNSADELRQLRAATESMRQSENDSLGNYFQALLSQSLGLGNEQLQISEEGQASSLQSKTSSPPSITETLLTLNVKEVNLRQLVRLIHTLETSRRPIKLRHLSIQAKEDLSGYLSATLKLSGFSKSLGDE